MVTKFLLSHHLPVLTYVMYINRDLTIPMSWLIQWTRYPRNKYSSIKLGLIRFPALLKNEDGELIELFGAPVRTNS